MASSKFYAYYVRGRKIALIEHDFNLGSGQTLDQPGLNNVGTRGDALWKSPSEAIASGLEIEYTYSPKYQVLSNATIDVNKFYVNGWTVIGGYLTFLRHRYNAAEVNWTSSPESAVTSGSSGDTGGQTLDYIVVKGSSRWNGLHKVQTAGTEGQLITYTKVPETVAYFEDQDIDFNTDEEVFDGGGSSNIYLADHYGTNDYVWISGCDQAANNGLFSISSVSQSATDTSSKITLGTKYGIVFSSDSTSSSTGLDSEYSAAAALTAASGESDINIYKAYRDFSFILTDVSVLSDEEDTIDLPSYLAQALVYYVKARVAEDRADIEQKEYNMHEFKRLLEINESSKIWGARRIGADATAIR